MAGVNTSDRNYRETGVMTYTSLSHLGLDSSSCSLGVGPRLERMHLRLEIPSVPMDCFKLSDTGGRGFGLQVIFFTEQARSFGVLQRNR
jgi:hypothetical protein